MAGASRQVVLQAGQVVVDERWLGSVLAANEAAFGALTLVAEMGREVVDPRRYAVGVAVRALREQPAGDGGDGPRYVRVDDEVEGTET